MMSNEKNEMIGKMMIFEGLILLVPIIVLPFYREDIVYISSFLIPAFFSILLGYIISRLRSKNRGVNSSRIVTFAWLYGFFIAAMPFYLNGNITFVQSLFESISGFTTTGLSVLDVENTSHIFLFYRSFLQYVGGLGFVIMMLLFVQGKHSASLFQAEGHPDRLAPNMGKTAKLIFMMYNSLLVVGTILYVICKMPLFDSILHTMCALSTGGFSNRLDSIGYYHSFKIELVTVILMIIGTTNFSLLLLLFKGKIKRFFKASEVRFLIGLSIISIPVMALFLKSDSCSFLHGIRLAFFNAFSALSTTGYATCSYTTWSDNALVIMTLLMVIGGGIGSTAGGIKLGRVCKLLKNLSMNVKKKLVPERTVLITYYNKGTEKEVLDQGQVEEASTYAGVYLLLFLVGCISLTYFSKSSFLHAAFEFASSIGTVGLSIGLTNMDTLPICLIIEMVGMVLGRLEIFVLFKAFCKN